MYDKSARREHKSARREHKSARREDSPATVVSAELDQPSSLSLAEPFLQQSKDAKDAEHTPEVKGAASPLTLLGGATVRKAMCLALVAFAASSVGHHGCALYRKVAAERDLLPLDHLMAIAVAGFAAQLVDGSLGMGYGMTSSTVLVAAGVAPATASTSVHLAQLGTTALSGVAHLRFGNVHAPTTARIAPSGMLGAFLGAALLSSLPAKAAKPVAAGLLFVLGVYVLARFWRGKSHSLRAGRPGLGLLAPLGFAGGFVDATGGGGWGPVATSGLLADGRLRPNLVIGTVSASEFFVTVAAVAGFLTSRLAALGAGGSEADSVRAEIVLTLLLGGLLAAPVAPHLVGSLKPQLLGVVVGGFICFTNARGLLAAARASPQGFCCFYAALLGVWGLAIVRVASGAACSAAQE